VLRFISTLSCWML